MVHQFSMQMYYPDGPVWLTYECDDAQPRLWGNNRTCTIVDGARNGEKVTIHNDMIVQAVTDTHARQDTGMSRPGCYCDYCRRKRLVE